jgi:hypothetical protein
MIPSRIEGHFILNTSGVDARGWPLKSLASHQTLAANRPLYPKRLDLLRDSLAENYPPIQALILRFASVQQLQIIYDWWKEELSWE